LFFIFTDHITYTSQLISINIRFRNPKARKVELSGILGRVLCFHAAGSHKHLVLNEILECGETAINIKKWKEGRITPPEQ
jgi:hypothetical protein